jgi:hypothetical protein
MRDIAVVQGQRLCDWFRKRAKRAERQSQHRPQVSWSLQSKFTPAVPTRCFTPVVHACSSHLLDAVAVFDPESELRGARGSGRGDQPQLAADLRGCTGGMGVNGVGRNRWEGESGEDLDAGMSLSSPLICRGACEGGGI